MMRGALKRPPVLAVVEQHVDDAALLRATRTRLVRSGHAKLLHLERADERLAAHLDGVLVAGPLGQRLGTMALAAPAVGEAFVAAWLAVVGQDTGRLERLAAAAEVIPGFERAMGSALGWVEPTMLRGWLNEWLVSSVPIRRRLALAACALQRRDPGAPLRAAFNHADPSVRAAAARTAAVSGSIDCLDAVMAAVDDSDVGRSRVFAQAAVLLGDRGTALAALGRLALHPDVDAVSLAVYLLGAVPEDRRRLLDRLQELDAPTALRIRAARWALDRKAVPWLLDRMATPLHARAAGEALSAITGLPVVDELESPTTPTADSQAFDGIADDGSDDGLPWPAPKAWRERLSRGDWPMASARPDPSELVSRLISAPQRARTDAALRLVLSRPGSSLFNTAAPAVRQRAELQG